MDHQQLATTRRHLGELGVMADQTQRAEQQILQRAEQLLGEVDKRMSEDRAAAQAGDRDAADRYMADTEERGRLETVIAQAREHLGK